MSYDEPPSGPDREALLRILGWLLLLGVVLALLALADRADCRGKLRTGLDRSCWPAYQEISGPGEAKA